MTVAIAKIFLTATYWTIIKWIVSFSE